MFVAAESRANLHEGVTASVATVEGLLEAHRYVEAVNAILELDADGVDHAILRPLIARMGRLAAGDAAEHDLVGRLLALILELRESARNEKRWSDADSIRYRLTELGISINDGPDGASWTRS